MQYNGEQYNQDSYNLTNYTSLLTESVTPSDVVTNMTSIVCTDSQGTADALSDGVSLTALLDTVTIYQRAHTPFSYNNGRYNDFMYNVRADEDEILLMPSKVVDETVILVDVMAPFVVEKLLTEILTSTDSITFDSTTFLQEVTVVDELFSIQVTNKALSEHVRLNDWVTVKQSPQSDQWGDQ